MTGGGAASGHDAATGAVPTDHIAHKNSGGPDGPPLGVFPSTHGAGGYLMSLKMLTMSEIQVLR